MTVTTCGWFSCATALASRRKRSSCAGSLERGVERAVHARHPARADLLLEPEALAYEGPDHRHLFSALPCRYACATTPTLRARRPGPPSPSCAGSSLSSAP